MQLLNLWIKKRKERATNQKLIQFASTLNVIQRFVTQKSFHSSLLKNQVHRMILKNEVHRFLNPEQQDSNPQFCIREVCMFCGFK